MIHVDGGLPSWPCSLLQTLRAKRKSPAENRGAGVPPGYQAAGGDWRPIGGSQLSNQIRCRVFVGMSAISQSAAISRKTDNAARIVSAWAISSCQGRPYRVEALLPL